MIEIDPTKLSTKKPASKCPVLGCTNARGMHQRRCSRCNMALWRRTKPIRAYFSRVIASANRRQIHFDISYAEFVAFCEKTQYHILAGNDAEDMTIERKDSRQGYVIANLDVLTRRENGRKGGGVDKKLHATWKAFHAEIFPF